MSLLMDALRKAEEAKRNAAAEAGAPPAQASSLELEPLTAPAPPPESETAMPEPAPAPSQPTIAPGEAGPRRAQPASRPSKGADPQSEAASRAAIQNTFAVKQADSGSRNFALVVGSLGTLAAVAIGIYFWWQLQPRQSPLLAGPAPSVAPAAIPAPPPVATTAPPPAAPIAQPAPPPAAAPVNTPPGRSVADAREISTDRVFSSRTEVPARAAASPPSPIRIANTRPRLNPNLSQAYEALQSGNLALAQQAYERVLATDPKNSDAFYGLAAIALQRNQAELAEDYYLRAIEADPRDAIAHAGLAGLRGKAGGANTESRLKILMAEQPGVAALPFALGNLYSREERWRDAQQAYFLAYKADSENPDIAFNLAVSLDQLHQGKLAAQYYGEALRLAAKHPSGFSQLAAQARLRELQGDSSRAIDR